LEERARKAEAIWEAAIEPSDELVAYFEGRGIDAVPANARYLTRQEAHKLTGKHFAALVMPIVKPAEPDAEVFPNHDDEDRVGVQLTFLTRDETSNAKGKDGKSVRKAYGPVAGGHVPLATSNSDKPLLVGEGIETVLSGMQVTGLPGIAVRSAGNMPKVHLPQASQVIILADRDESGTGTKWANEAAQRWSDEGRVVRIALPPTGHGDFNDALRAGIDPEVMKRLILEADPAAAEEGDDGEQVRAQIDARLDELADLDDIEYERLRKGEAERLGLRASVLDREVAKRRDSTQADAGLEFLKPVEPWHEEVDGGALLDELYDVLERHIVMPPSSIVATALWILHAHAHDAALHSPILFISSPTKRCGKTNLLTMIGRLTPKPLSAANVTPATVFRAIERWHPTMLIDEVDTFFEDKSELRGVLNSGHNRSGAFVVRCVGDDLTPKLFSTWSPKAFAAIGRINPTLEDRSIIIGLKRKLSSETVARVPKEPDAYLDLHRKCARWGADNLERLKRAHPKLPAELHDRARDNWEPLLAIANACGGEWPEETRDAALRLSAVDDDETPGIMLLEDFRKLFAEEEGKNISSQGAADKLAEMEARPWPEFQRGSPITARGIAKLLAPFKIRPRQVLIRGHRVQGYMPKQFDAAFKRYLQDPDTSSASPEKPVRARAYDGKHPLNGDRTSGDNSKRKRLNLDDNQGMQRMRRHRAL
jgi:putative DNA primase/helicase